MPPQQIVQPIAISPQAQRASTPVPNTTVAPAATSNVVDMRSPTVQPVVLGAPGWGYQRVLVSDLDGNGTSERVVTLADAMVQNGQTLWDDGHRWQVYIEDSTGTVTSVYRQFLQLGRLDVSITEASNGQPPTVLILEQAPSHLSIYETSFQAGQAQTRLVLERSIDTTTSEQ